MNTLASIAHLHSGYSARTALTKSPTGTTAIIQPKDIEAQTANDTATLERVRLPWTPPHHFIEAKDMVFCARTTLYRTLLLAAPTMRTLCIAPLIHIRVRDATRVLPEYLAWYLNTQAAQAALQTVGFGKVRLGPLKALPVPVPELAQQQHILAVLAVNSQILELEKRLSEQRHAYTQQTLLKMVRR